VLSASLDRQFEHDEVMEHYSRKERASACEEVLISLDPSVKRTEEKL
jgi:hypothetical protein